MFTTPTPSLAVEFAHYSYMTIIWSTVFRVISVEKGQEDNLTQLSFPISTWGLCA